MEDSQKEQEVFRQNLDEKGSFQTLFQSVPIVYRQRNTPRRGKYTQSVICQIREGGYCCQREGLPFDFPQSGNYIVEYKDNQRMPAQVLMSDFENFDGNNIDLMQRSQLWDCPDKDEILANCKYKIMLSDFMASGLPYKERCAPVDRMAGKPPSNCSLTVRQCGLLQAASY